MAETTKEDARQAARAEGARRYDEAAEQLEIAARHLRTAARHFCEADVPRGCAHAWAARGHVLRADRLTDENAIQHSAKAIP